MKRQLHQKTEPAKGHSIAYYLTALVVIAGLPIFLLFIYNEFAGGLLAGLGGYIKPRVIDDDFMEWIASPAVMILGYIGFLVIACKHLSAVRHRRVQRIVSWIVFALVTLMVCYVTVLPSLKDSFPWYKAADWMSGRGILWPDKYK